MATEIRVPTLGESVTEATIGRWFKTVGEAVAADEPLVELETDKVTVEVPAPTAGVIEAISARNGETVGVGALLGTLSGDGAGAAPGAREPQARAAAGRPDRKSDSSPAIDAGPEQTPARREATVLPLPPAARKLAAEHDIEPAAIAGSGRDGRVTKGDVLKAIRDGMAVPAPTPEPPAAATRPRAQEEETALEERVPMSRLRQTIARRLKEAQNTAAMLTTFNEVDMTAVMALRSQYKELFEKTHGVKLGFMSFFVKAVVQALREIPAVNAEIDGTDIVYKSCFHIGVAVGTERGLVVPVLRDADRLGFAAIEKGIAELGRRAREGSLSIDDLQGGTFTISNGGVYGSLLSTPILNAPQSGVLGMHKIEERPVVIGGQIVARPMMYLALTYDHRIVDGREAVTFLVRVKESLEDPQRMVLEL